jgi:hypothetical protein
MVNLPKFLVDKIGRDKLLEAMNQPVPEFPAIPDIMVQQREEARREFYRTHGSPTGTARIEGRKRHNARASGKLPPMEVYSLDEAIEHAGL